MNILFVGIRENELTTSAPKRIANTLYNRLRIDTQNSYYFFSLNFDNEKNLQEQDSNVFIGALNELDSFIKNNNIDVVYFARYYSKVALKLLWLKQKYKFKLVYTVHGIVKKEAETNKSFSKLSVFIETILLQFCDKIVVVSSNSKNEILNYYKTLNANKIYVIPNGVNKIDSDSNFNFKKELNINNNKNNILTVGIRKIKNIEILLNEFVGNSTLYNKTNLIVIGEKQSEYGKFIVNKYKNYTNIIFVNFIEPKKLFKIYENIDLYIQISQFETFGMSVVEAILSNAKVLISSNLPISKYFANDEVYYYDKQINDLSDVILSALNDSNEKKIKAYKKATELFNWQTTSDKYKCLFESFIIK